MQFKVVEIHGTNPAAIVIEANSYRPVEFILTGQYKADVLAQVSETLEKIQAKYPGSFVVMTHRKYEDLDRTFYGIDQTQHFGVYGFLIQNGDSIISINKDFTVIEPERDTTHGSESERHRRIYDSA